MKDFVSVRFSNSENASSAVQIFNMEIVKIGALNRICVISNYDLIIYWIKKCFIAESKRPTNEFLIKCRKTKTLTQIITLAKRH